MAVIFTPAAPQKHARRVVAADAMRVSSTSPDRHRLCRLMRPNDDDLSARTERDSALSAEKDAPSEIRPFSSDIIVVVVVVVSSCAYGEV